MVCFSSIVFSTFSFFEAGYFIELRICQFSYTGCQQVPGILLSLLPQHLDYKRTPWSLVGLCGIKPQVLMVLWQALH